MIIQPSIDEDMAMTTTKQVREEDYVLQSER
jgi:hypothetical protein